MNFSLKTEYALRAIYQLSLAADSKPVNREIIAKKQEIPVHYLENILISLKKHGLVKSVRGPGGGYLLAREAIDINIWDIYRAVDYREYEGVHCFPSLTSECNQLDKCKIKPIWFEFNEKIKTTMQSLTLNSIAG